MMDLASELNSIWAVAAKGKYQRALEMYDETISRGLKLPSGHDANRGLILLCLNKYDEALTQFSEATARRKASEETYRGHEGVAQWLMGRHRDAVAAWRLRVAGIRSGTILYTDFAGGASDGLLLWYAAVTLKDHDLLKYTMEFFHELSAPDRVPSWPGLSSWPGPLVYLALGEKSAEAIVQQHFGDKELGRLLYRNQGVLQRRELVNALFYSAVSRRAAGQENECRKIMSAVVQIENPLVELDWYLARGELS